MSNRNKKTAEMKQLICAVRLINTPAARYLNGTEVTKLDSFSMPDTELLPSETLQCIFYWSETKQGHSFWSAVCRQLKAAEAEKEQQLMNKAKQAQTLIAIVSKALASTDVTHANSNTTEEIFNLTYAMLKLSEASQLLSEARAAANT